MTSRAKALPALPEGLLAKLNASLWDPRDLRLFACGFCFTYAVGVILLKVPLALLAPEFIKPMQAGLLFWGPASFVLIMLVVAFLLPPAYSTLQGLRLRNSSSKKEKRRAQGRSRAAVWGPDLASASSEPMGPAQQQALPRLSSRCPVGWVPPWNAASPELDQVLSDDGAFIVVGRKGQGEPVVLKHEQLLGKLEGTGGAVKRPLSEGADPRFAVGDLVQRKGYSGKIFQIVYACAGGEFRVEQVHPHCDGKAPAELGQAAGLAFVDQHCYSLYEASLRAACFGAHAFEPPEAEGEHIPLPKDAEGLGDDVVHPPAAAAAPAAAPQAANPAVGGAAAMPAPPPPPSSIS
jgi:hypothetical protein